MSGLLLLACAPLMAQQPPAAYRQQLLAIQQRIETGDLDGARSLLSAAQARYPADGGLENLLGVVEIQQGHTDEARNAFRAAIRHSPHLVSALMNLSRIDMQTAATDNAARVEARRMSQQVLALEPANDEARYQLASILVWSGQHREALAQIARLSEETRHQPQVQSLGCASEAFVGLRPAMEQAAAALAANPSLTEQDADTCLAGLRKAHRADLIAALYAAAAARQPLTPQGQRALGLAQEAEGKLVDARTTLEAAFTASQGKDSVLLVDLTRIAEAAGDHNGALGYVAHARDLMPADPELPYEFGVICLRMSLFGEARKAFAEAVRLAPENPQYNYGLGSVISFSQDPSQALPYLEKFRILRPADPAGTLALGVTNFRAKDYGTALRWLHQAAESKQTAADAHYYLGRIARQESRTSDAVSELKQALALDSNRADVLAELGQIAVLERDYPQAEEYLNRALRIEPNSYAANFGLLQLYARTEDARREQQSKRFDEIKDEKQERDRLMMRVIEVRPEGGASALQPSHETKPADTNEPQQEKR
jgi:Flp pilus assembly protein TadD